MKTQKGSGLIILKIISKKKFFKKSIHIYVNGTLIPAASIMVLFEKDWDFWKDLAQLFDNIQFILPNIKNINWL